MKRTKREGIMSSSRILCCVLAVLFAWCFVSTGAVVAAERPIKIGYLAPLTGSWAQAGADMRDAWMLYVGQNGDKVAGRNIQVIVEDSQAKPDVCLTKLKKLVEKDKVDIVAGIHSSGEAYAIRDYIHNQKVPLMLCNAGADDLTKQKWSPYIFRSSFANSQHNLAFGEWVYKKLGKRKMVIIGMDYPGGWEWLGSMAYGFIKAGGQVIQEFYTPMDTSDFSPYLTALNRDADVVYHFYTGQEAIRFHTQYNEYGLYGKIQNTGGIGGIDETIYPQIGDIIVGTYTSGVHGYPKEPLYIEYRKAFETKFGRLPGTFADASYMGAIFVVEALKKVGGNVENKEEFLKALKSIKIAKSGWGPLSLDAYGNTIHDVQVQKLVRKGKTFDIDVVDVIPQVSQFWDFTPEEFAKKVPNWSEMKGKWVGYKLPK
ncbi:MAG: ABC transporter substrate-binding protein [Syntrophorhabdales bacterium]